jgi:hypothetical protein
MTARLLKPTVQRALFIPALALFGRGCRYRAQCWVCVCARACVCVRARARVCVYIIYRGIAPGCKVGCVIVSMDLEVESKGF